MPDFQPDCNPSVTSKVTMRRVCEVVCANFAITDRALRGRRRTKDLLLPRQLAFLLCRELTGRTTSEIGRWFKRHHTTVIHGADAALKRLAAEKPYRMIREICLRELQNDPRR